MPIPGQHSKPIHIFRAKPTTTPIPNPLTTSLLIRYVVSIPLPCLHIKKLDTTAYICCIYNMPSLNTSANELAELVASQCLAGRARRLNRVITNVYDRALQPHGIKINQASILVFLLAYGDASPGEIGARLQMEKSTVSRTIDRMEKSGWISVEGKGPGQTVRVTELGRQLMVDCHEQWKEAQQKAFDLLGKEGASSLMQIADRLKP